DPEPVSDGTGTPAGDGCCVGLALALTAVRPGWTGARLRLMPADRSRATGEKARAGVAPEMLRLEGLLRALTAPDMRTVVVWQFDEGDRLELERAESSKGHAGSHAWPAVSGRVSVGSSGAGAENSL